MRSQGAENHWSRPWKHLDIESKNIQVVAQLVSELDSNETWACTWWSKDSVGRDKVITWGCGGMQWWGCTGSWYFLPRLHNFILKEELKSWISPKGGISLKNRQMAVSNKSKIMEESGSPRVGLARARETFGDDNRGDYRLCERGLDCGAAKAASWEVQL